MRNVVKIYESVELIYKCCLIFLLGTMAEVKLECSLFFSLSLAYLVCYHGLPKL